jgi:hypothetical protein
LFIADRSCVSKNAVRGPLGERVHSAAEALHAGGNGRINRDHHRNAKRDTDQAKQRFKPVPADVTGDQVEKKAKHWTT